MKYFILVICAVWLYGCEICGSNGPESEEVASEALCKYWWYMNYTDFDNATIKLQLHFSLDGKGREIISRSIFGQTDSREYEFTWYWVSDAYASICMKYGENNVSYIEEIFITDDVLTCFREGNRLTFYGR